jgi:hypothetical protein
MSTAKPLDAAWHARLLPLLHAVPEAYLCLMPDQQHLAASRQAFVASEYRSDPDLRPSMDTAPHHAVVTELQAFLNDVNRAPSGPVAEAYRARIEEWLIVQQLIIAAAEGNSDTFDTANAALYGTPDAELFAGVCGWIRRDAIDENHAELLELLPETDASILDHLPTIETFRRVQALHRDGHPYYKQLFANIQLPTKGMITQETGTPIVRQVLANLQSDYTLKTTTDSLWSVSHSDKHVLCPATYGLTRQAFIGIICHEIGSHLLEALRGAEQPLQLLQSGLDRYEAGNEGRACVREQIQYPDILTYTRLPSWSSDGTAPPSFGYRAALHLVISLAVGLDGRRWRFHELYHLTYLLQRLWQSQRHGAVDDATCHDFAWHITTRALKGTDGSGGAYRKDMVYLEGNLRCWQQAARDPACIMWGDAGKFDIANPRHIAILQQIGVLPA